MNFMLKDLHKLLQEDIVTVIFRKKNGEIREMVCTQMPEHLPETSGNGNAGTEVTTVFDLDNQGWRSFRNDSIIGYEIVN